MPRANRFMGRYLRHGEGFPDWSLRLFDRRSAQWSDDAVHEKVVVASGTVGRLPEDAVLMHHSAESLATYLDKQNRYTSLQADALYRRGERATVWRLLLSPTLRFVKFYVLRLGFPRRAAGAGAHRDRLLQQLRQVREVAGAADRAGRAAAQRRAAAHRGADGPRPAAGPPMTHARDRLRRLHRLLRLQGVARARRGRRRHRQPERLLRCAAQARPARAAAGTAGIPLRGDRHRRRRVGHARVHRGAFREGPAPGGTGRRPLLARQPGGLHAQQPDRLRERRRGLPTPRSRPPGVRQHLVGLRRQSQAAVLGDRPRRSSGELLRGDEEGERADGAQLQPSVRTADDGDCASSRCTDRGAVPT